MNMPDLADNWSWIEEMRPPRRYPVEFEFRAPLPGESWDSYKAAVHLEFENWMQYLYGYYRSQPTVDKSAQSVTSAPTENNAGGNHGREASDTKKTTNKP